MPQPDYYKPFSPACHCTCYEAVLLACLVEAEIVPPYHGILINISVGNPTIPLVLLLELGKFQTAARRTLDIHPLYKEA